MGCYKTRQSNQNYNTGGIGYDGAPLTCLSFTNGTLNDVLVEINTAICTINTSLNVLTIGSDDVILENLDPSTCFSATNFDTLTTYLNEVQAYICGLITSLANLSTDNIAITPLTLGCFTNSYSSLTDLLDEMIVNLCNVNSGWVKYSDFYSTLVPATITVNTNNNGDYSTPLYPFIVGTSPTLTDVSYGGDIILRISGATYWTDGKYTTKAQEDIILQDNYDNYLFLDNQNSFDWNYAAITNNDPQPTTNGVKVILAQVISGTITNTILLKEYPIDADLIADNAIYARHLNSDVEGEAISLNVTTNVLDVLYDGTTVGLNISNELEVVDDGITAAKLNTDTAGDGLVKNIGTLALDVNAGNSLEVNSNTVQLVNDQAPVANTFYGVSGAGVLGWQTPLEITYKTNLVDADTDSFIVGADTLIKGLSIYLNSITGTAIGLKIGTTVGGGEIFDSAHFPTILVWTAGDWWVGVLSSYQLAGGTIYITTTGTQDIQLRIDYINNYFI
jgi:hypothetical protein